MDEIRPTKSREVMDLTPKIIAESGEFRLVHQHRDQSSWPTLSDLTLERLGKDALYNPRWDYVTSWVLHPLTKEDGLAIHRKQEEQVRFVLQLLTSRVNALTEALQAAYKDQSRAQ